MAQIIIDDVVQDKLEDLLEYLQDAPVNIHSAILHDELYDIVYKSVISDMAAMKEDKDDEDRLDAYYDED